MLSLVLFVIFACSRVNCFLPYRPNYPGQFQSQGQGYPPYPPPPNQGYNGALDLKSLTQGLPLPPSVPQNLVPVALTSGAATPTTFPPLRISVRKNALLVSKNDGFLVYSVPAPGQSVVATLTGGPARGFPYDFAVLAQNEDNVANATRASTTEDNVGFPAQIQMFFYKREYGSFRNALTRSDGVIIIPFNILVEGTAPNKLFVPYGQDLDRIRQANSTSTINACDAFEWLLSTFEPGYYTHPSSYIDLYTGIKEFPCATNIQPNFAKHPYVSYPQFKSFLNLRNGNNQPLANPLPLFPLADRQFLQADDNSPVSYGYY